MKPIHRSLSGLALAVLAAPILMSLLACLPVPIGDPEKSRIDPELNGMWIMMGDDIAVVLFEPYDKRTWLLTMAGLSIDSDQCPDEEESEDQNAVDYDTLVQRAEKDGADCLTADGEVSLFKAWRTELARQWFMTWEQKGYLDDDYGFASEYWWGFRLDKINANEFSLRFIDGGHDAFDDLQALEKIEDAKPPYDSRDLKAGRREVERAIRKHVDDEALYDDDAMIFYRVLPEHQVLFGSIIDDVIGAE